MSNQHEHDDTTLEIESIESVESIADTEDFATDWLETWALTDFADLIDQQIQEMSGVEVYRSPLTELMG